MEESKVLISILNWNNWRNAIETVHSVLLSEYKNYKVIIIDNNSTDKSVISLKEYFPELEVWSLKKNIGYAGAHKLTADFAVKNKYHLLWILNNDVQVYPVTLSEFVKAYKKNGDSLLGSVTLESDGKTIHYGGGLEMTGNAIDESSKYNQFGGKNFFETAMLERPVSDLQGSSFVIPVSLIKKHGFIDTRFFLYGEEADYCYKLRRKYGIQSVVVPLAKVIHKGGESFNVSPMLSYIKAYYRTRNDHHFHYKYFNPYKIEGNKSFIQFLKYFFKHIFITAQHEKTYSYLVNYYTNLGAFHALLHVRGKYLEPNNYVKQRAIL